MKLPMIQGTIHRRILVNFRVESEVMQRNLPGRFRPKLQSGCAVAGICLIRLEHVRPKGMPEVVGMSSENAAHRVAVLWDEVDSVCEGVFIPRRDTDSQLNHLLGGRIFPGEYNKAAFTVRQNDSEVEFAMRSDDGNVAVEIKGRMTDALPSSSIFSTLDEASAFFESGSLGYSVTKNPNRLDGMRLATKEWRVEALDVSKVSSSYFNDEAKFPRGSVEFDHALIMRNIPHEWHSAAELYV